MDYELIASDFDGTIYTSDYHIADDIPEAIADYRAIGGNVMVSTGRLYASIKQQLPHLGLVSGAVIVEQGANVVDVATGDIILSYDIEPALAAQCVRDMEAEPGYYALIYYKGGCLTEAHNPLISFFEHIIMVDIEDVNMPLSSYIEQYNIAPTKILCITMPGDQTDVDKRLGAQYKMLNFARSTDLLVEVVDRDASKGNALEYVAQHIYHVPREKIIALGDADNDISMIEYAGLGVAMGNAMDTVKAVADIVADTNDNSGVAKIIREYGIGENGDE